MLERQKTLLRATAPAPRLQRPAPAGVTPDTPHGVLDGSAAPQSRDRNFGDVPVQADPPVPMRDATDDKKLAECLQAAGPDPSDCEPKTPPDWSAFSGPVDTDSPWHAQAAWTMARVDVPSQVCQNKMTGSASGAARRFQGRFNPAESWVKPEWAHAADPAKNGSAALVADCQADFDGLKRGETGVFRIKVSDCAASPKPDGKAATHRAECKPVVTQSQTRWAVAEAARLLKHEQSHQALSCAMAAKANALLAAGTAFTKLDAAIDNKLDATQKQFDNETAHGCDAAGQATWQKAIADGLPAVKLP